MLYLIKEVIQIEVADADKRERLTYLIPDIAVVRLPEIHLRNYLQFSLLMSSSSIYIYTPRREQIEIGFTGFTSTFSVIQIGLYEAVLVFVRFETIFDDLESNVQRFTHYILRFLKMKKVNIRRLLYLEINQSIRKNKAKSIKEGAN